MPAPGVVAGLWRIDVRKPIPDTCGDVVNGVAVHDARLREDNVKLFGAGISDGMRDPTSEARCDECDTYSAQGADQQRFTEIDQIYASLAERSAGHAQPY